MITVAGIRAYVDLSDDTIRVWDPIAQHYIIDRCGVVSAWARGRILAAAHRAARRAGGSAAVSRRTWRRRPRAVRSAEVAS